MNDSATGGPKVALVTGANRGIGFEIARQLAQQGVTVLLGARNQAAGDEAASRLAAEGLDVIGQQIDVSNAASISAAAQDIESRFGKLDILVNNAGISIEKGVAPSDADIELMRQTYETNVFGPVAVIQAMLPLLRKSPAGRIVNMSTGLASLALTSGPDAPMHRMQLLSYNSSKTALNAVTVQFANELFDTPIKVNSANPGLCATELSSGKGRPPADGATVAVRLALLDSDGPTGGMFGEEGQTPW